MSVTRIPFDGLWRCLCPSIITIVAASYSSYVYANPRQPPINRHYNSRGLHSRRPFHTSRIAGLGNHEQNISDGQYLHGNPQPSQNTRSAKAPYKPENFDHVPLTHLYERLRHLKTKERSYHKIVQLVEYLINVRGEKPSVLHYDALIIANADAEDGSAGAVRTLLQEMKEGGIGLDSGVFHSALQVLAVHPDYVLRSEIMEDMKRRWFGLSPGGWHSLVTGLIRDRQFEMAMDKLEQMQADGVKVQPWLYDIFTYQLCEVGELDEAFKILQYRFENGRTDISSSTWYYLLDAFSSAFYYEGTKYIWKRRIQTSYLTPSDGICVNVLNLAARHGDPGLATSAVRILSSRRSTLAIYHYEALLASYVADKDLKTSIRILGIMEKVGLKLDSSVTRHLYLYLSESTDLAKEAWEVLKGLHERGHTIPIAAANVVIESVIQNFGVKLATEMYKELHIICENGPDTETFNHLFRGLSRRAHKEKAMWLASEMGALGVKPDNLTYDRLILICLEEEDYEDAFRYLEEMTAVGKGKEVAGQKGWWLRGHTASALIKRCVEGGDKRAWDLLAEMESRGLAGKERDMRMWVEDNWKGDALSNVTDNVRSSTTSA